MSEAQIMESVFDVEVTDDGGRRGRRGHTQNHSLYHELHIEIQTPPSCVPCVPERHRPNCFWSLARALWLEYDADTPLALGLVEWAERRHREAFDHLCRSLASPRAVRKTLGAIGRRMRAEQPEDFAALVAADEYGWSVLGPYVERTATEEDDARIDAVWRGVRDEADRICVEYLRDHSLPANVDLSPAPR